MKKAFFIIAGWLSLITGLIGIVLPLLPTTPFMLLSAFCFSQSSARLHRWLCNHPWFGPPIQQWLDNHTVSRNTKTKALFLIVASFSLTLILAPLPLIGKASLLLLALILMWSVARLPESSQSDTAGSIQHDPSASPTKEES